MVPGLAGVGPAELRLDGAVLFADISGYTELTETMLARGEEGLERLSGLLDRALGHYVTLVQGHGGEVLSFAGDALIAHWPAETGTIPSDATRRAVRCAERLVAWEGPVERGLRPQLHIGVDCGPLWCARVGDDEQRALVFGGASVRGALQAGASAGRGEIATTVRAREALHVHGSTVASMLADSVAPPGYVHASEPPAPSSRGRGAWTPELRHVTALFVRVDGFDEDAPDSLSRLDHAVREVQAALRPFSASPGRWGIDDKGLYLLVVFGVPLNAHKDDGSRALRGALAIEAALARLATTCSIGIASGKVFCGPIGAPLRRENVAIGRAMNLAARLMSAGMGVLYAGATAGIEDDLALEPAGPLTVKGFVEPVTVYSVRSRAGRGSAAPPIHGREAERKILRDALDVVREGPGGTVVIEGEAGIGKSVLVDDLVARARASGVHTVVTSNDPSEHSPALSAWRSVFREVLGARASDDAATIASLADRWFARHPDLKPFAPLLSAALRVELPETDVTRHMDAPARVERTIRFLAEVLDAALPRPALVVVEDGHWMDPDSWLLARAVAELDRVLLVLTTRPVPRRPEEQAFRDRPGVVELVPTALDAEAIAQLVRDRLDASSVADGLVASVLQRSAGNPLVAAEVVYMLRETERAVPQSGHWVLVTRESQAPESQTPLSVRGLVADRVDNLTPVQAMTLKAASAVGSRFSPDLLRQILPYEAREDVLVTLTDLTSHQFVEPGSDAGGYAFRHDLFREVVYDLMLHDQRRALHASIARALEARGGAVESALLARHWFSAGDLPRTLRHADAAATQALQAGAYREAIYFVEQCIECAAQDPALRPDTATLTRWRRQLADAHHGLGDLVRRRADATRALEAAHVTVNPKRPNMAASVVLRLGNELVASALPSMRGLLPSRATPSELHPDLARVYRHLVELAYFDNDGLGMLWGALHAVESAKRASLLSDLARAYAQLGGTLGLAPRLPLAGVFLRRAVDAARRSSDPHAEAYAHMITCLHGVGMAEWELVERSTTACIRLGERTGDSATTGNARMVRFWSAYYRGVMHDAWREATALRDLATEAQHNQHGAWARRALGLLSVRAGDGKRAIPWLEEARAAISEGNNVNEMLETDGILAHARLLEGDLVGAEQAARGALALARSVSIPTSHGTLSGIVGSLETVFALHERTPSMAGWEPMVRDAIDTLGRYRRTFAVARPALHRWRGRWHASRGEMRRAKAEMKAGERVAEELGMAGAPAG
jgi:class 3 adenylate cyclase